MYAPVAGVGAVPVATRAKSAWPLAAICCLGLLALLIVATIVLALIPVYLSSKNTAATTSTSSSKNFYVQYQASQIANAYNQPAGTINNPAAIGALAGLGNNGAFTAGTATPAITRRRRGVLNGRGKRALVSNIFFYCQPIFGIGCLSAACQTAAVTTLQQAIQKKGNIASAPLNISANGTAQSFTLSLTFIGFISGSTPPPGFGSSFTFASNFTAAQSGLFNSPTTWIGNIIPYGNATVLIPSGITVTIANSTLDVPVQVFDVSGTLAVGQGASTFTFSYPTTIIIESGGTFQDLTTSKTLTLQQGSSIQPLTGSTSPTGSTVTMGSGGGGKRQVTALTITITTITVVVVEVIRPFPRITHFCRRNGAFSSPFAYIGGFAPQASICKTAGCGLCIPRGITLSTAELVGVMTIQIIKITVDVGGTLQLTSGGSGFRFNNAIQFDVSGTFNFIGSGGIKAVGGCALNLFQGASFVSVEDVEIVTITVGGDPIGTPLDLGSSVTIPYFVNVAADGTSDDSHTDPFGTIDPDEIDETTPSPSGVTTPLIG